MPHSILSTVGRTPLVELRRVLPGWTIHAKLEMFNPTGSAKDRAGLSMIRDALDKGLVQGGGTVIESSSGNMGLALAQACHYFGIRFICVVDERTSTRTIDLLRACQADVEVAKQDQWRADSPLAARLQRIAELQEEIKGAYWTNQYANPANSLAHHETMKEIVSKVGRQIDYVLVATSTCGTLAGCVEYARGLNMTTKFVAVDAQGSVTFHGMPGPRKLPGHGIAIVPELYRDDLASECYRASDRECVDGCRWLWKSESIFAGASSGAVITALRHLSARIPPDARVVVILHDRGDRYLDTVYSDSWVSQLAD
jgi:N-(2-amino-2-carboxyethyl)-L-glutamate synthase